jgi:biuret amidohydrolase
MSRAALLLNEFQREWLDPDGVLYRMVPEAEMSSVVTAASEAVRSARSAGVAVVHSGVRLTPGYAELGQARFGLRRDLARTQRFAGRRADLVVPFAPVGDEYVSWRPGTVSDFNGSGLDQYLRNQGITQLYIAGFALHVCVLATAIHANDLGYDVTLLADACGCFTPAQREFTLDVMHHYGNHVTVAEFAVQITADDQIPVS